MRITAAHITNFKRIEDVKIMPSADRTVILLGGKNRQGKSSTLDALTAAFGGKKTLPADPVRHGADEAEIRVELDGGELTVRRVIQPDGESVLEVRDRLGAVKSPQAVLDKLIGARFLDPLQFLSLPPKEQRAQLMRVIGEADRIAQLDSKRERAFAKRTEVGRDLAKAEGELARLPPVEVGAPIDVAELTLAKSTITAEERERDRLASALAQAETLATVDRADLEATKQRIAKLEAELAQLRAQLPAKQDAVATRESAVVDAKDKLAAADKRLAELAPQRARIDADIARADQHNRTVYAQQAHMQRRAEALATVEQLKTERDNITKAIAVIDERKAEILAAAKLPVEGLGVDGDGVTLNGVPLAQASGAERFRVALALAIAASPGLDDVWIRDAALLDEDHLALIAEQAAAAGKRVWLERVGTSDPGVIVIQDGKVVADKSEAA
jgi:DNA repair exonuclease SbcCD ATPase subunit